MRLKIGNFLKHLIISRTRERKSPIHRKGLFKAFKTLSEFQLHAGKELDAGNGIIIVKLVFLVRQIINQRKGSDLVIHLIVGTEAEVEKPLLLLLLLLFFP